MRKAFTQAVLAASVYFAALVSAPHSALAETNGICQVLPSPAPSLTSGSYPVVPACGTDHNLQVDVVSGGGGGGGGGGSVTAAGTNGTLAQAIQGINGGIAVPVSGTFYQATQPVSLTTLPALAAGTAAIGQVGGKTNTVTVTPTISTSAYTAGYEVGQLLSFPNILLTAQSGILQSATVVSKSLQSGIGYKLYIFTTNPTNTTWTDHTTPAIATGDKTYVVDTLSLASGDNGLGTHTLYADDGIGRALNGTTTTLYGILVTTGAPTFTTTSDISVSLTVLDD